MPAPRGWAGGLICHRRRVGCASWNATSAAFIPPQPPLVQVWREILSPLDRVLDLFEVPNPTTSSSSPRPDPRQIENLYVAGSRGIIRNGFNKID